MIKLMIHALLMRAGWSAVAASLAATGVLAITTGASAAPARACTVGAYGHPGSFSYTVHIPRTCGGQERASALVNGQWVHGSWISRPGTSKAPCKGSCPPLRWRAWGWDYRHAAGSASHYHQIGHS